MIQYSVCLVGFGAYMNTLAVKLTIVKYNNRSASHQNITTCVYTNKNENKIKIRLRLKNKELETKYCLSVI